MKYLLFSLFALYSGFAVAQSNEIKAVRVNPLHENMHLLDNQAMKYKEFQKGKVIFKDSAQTEARLNFHRIYNEVLFLNDEGDTLALSNPETLAMIIMGTDTFFYFQKGYGQQITHYPDYNLVMKQTLKFIGKEKKGAYGSYSTTASVNSVSDLHVDEMAGITNTVEPGKTNLFKADENSIYTPNSEFFITDKFNNMFPANKKNVLNLFNKNGRAIKKYISNKKVNFKKQDDLVEIMEFIQQL